MTIDTGTILWQLLVAIVAAKVFAELAERVGVPAVVGEIVAGIVIGPSMLGLIGNDSFLLAIGEIGVVLLLLEVGLEMDIGELRAVGKAALLVAVVGVAAPFVLGFGAMRLSGNDFNTSLFVAAALTATSVGITARVFGDLRALTTVEARVVLGAAIADDVIGLVILTVVVRLVTEHSASVGGVGLIVATALLFLFAGGAVAIVVAPRLFAGVERLARSSGAVIAIAIGFTLAFAELADAAKLAPIVGAFLAGLALARTLQAERIRRELAPISNLLVPVFFVGIGLEAEISAFARVSVLRDAAILLAVAVVGKLVSPLGAFGSPGDKLTIGLGMLPRGEVGLIFAAIGLQTGVLGEDLYAALLLVVLLTTIVTPMLLKWRSQTVFRRHVAGPEAASESEPALGWIVGIDGEIRLRAVPPISLALPLAFEAAVLATHHRPSNELLDWFSTARNAPPVWTERASQAFLTLLGVGSTRSWRFLDALGILEDAFPELSAALRKRRTDPGILDGSSLHGWATLERVLEAGASPPLQAPMAELEHPERLLLAALLVDALPDRSARAGAVHGITQRLGLDSEAEHEITRLLDQPEVLWGMAASPDALREHRVFELAVHLENIETARAAYVMAAATGDGREEWERQRLDALYELVTFALSDPALAGDDARNIVARNRAEALHHAGTNRAHIERIEQAPRAYVLSQPASAVARHARLIDRLRRRDDVIVDLTRVYGGSGDRWWVDVVAVDHPGLLANVTGAIADEGLDILGAVVATWPDGVALESFLVRNWRTPVPARIRQRIEDQHSVPLTSAPTAGASVTFDDTVSPWHTLCEVRAPEQLGLAHRIAVAFAAARVDVHAARFESDGDTAIDRFDVTGRNGGKLDREEQDAMRTAMADGVLAHDWHRPRRRRFADRARERVSWLSG